MHHTPPMPLKHTTETFLMFLLVSVMVVTGMLMQTLPDLPSSLLPWALLFAISALYPILLSSLFRRNRADNFFRLLHWVPAGLLLLWMILQSVSIFVPWVFAIEDWFTWGWSLPAVATGFFLLTAFIFKVLRRWSSRIMLVLAAFIPFVVGGVANEYYDWTPQMTAILWQADFWQIGSGSNIPGLSNTGTIAGIPSSEKNLDASADISEERYRDRLRTMERRKDRIEQRLEERRLMQESSLSSEDDKDLGLIFGFNDLSSSDSSSSAPSIGQTSSMPVNLPSSGFGWNAIIIMMIAMYCGVLHKKTILRSEAV